VRIETMPRPENSAGRRIAEQRATGSV